MKIEQTKEAIRVMQAWTEGIPVECAERNNLKWGETLSPVWNWNNFTYRIKPTTVLRPWTTDEVPLGAWMRGISSGGYRWLIHTSSADHTRKEWLEHNEHSTDGGKTWLPCGVMEELK